MRFIASFADQVIASVKSVSISDTYRGLLEGSLSSSTKNHYMPEIEERIALIETGRLKGIYCFEPELMDESEFWGKDSRAKLNIADKIGQYTIELEWYQSTRELNETPLTELVQKAVGQLKFEEIKRFCRFYDWDEIS